MTVKIETERRFIVYAFHPIILAVPERKHIYQGYFDTPPEYERRVRIVDGLKGTLTRKDGSGLSRPEDEEKVFESATDAYAAMRETADQLEKVRYKQDGWEFDVYRYPLEGLYIAEFEHELAAQATLPWWIYRAREVTGVMTNRDLARIATARRHGRRNAPVHQLIEECLASR